MSHGTPKWRIRRSNEINVDELPILCYIRKTINSLLIDLEPL